MKELFGQSLNNTVAESDRIAVAVPGQIAAKNILFSKFWAQLKAIFGVNNWEAREYKSSPCIVVYDKKQYILDENLAPLPFLSENFADELLANIWVALGSTSDLTNYIKKTGETTIPEMASDDAICKTPLYNYYAASDPRGICPTGWHIPTQTEWDNLAISQGGASVAGGRLKDGGLVNWNSPNSGYSQNSLNFVGSGYRNFNGIFLDAKKHYSGAIGGDADDVVFCTHNSEAISTSVGCTAKDGRRIRCIKDDNVIPTGAVLDADGNSYNFVQLGSNIWLKEDLKTTRYNNGDLIQNIINDTTWSQLTTGARCYYPPINKYKSLVYTPEGDAKLLTPSTPSSETITVDNGAAYDDSVIYDTVTVVVFSNPSSPIVQFQTPQLYQSTVPLSVAGIDPEESPYDPEIATGNWWYVGDTLDVSESNTAITYIKGRPASVEISAITRCVHNQTISLPNYNSVIRFDKNAMSGIRPIDIPSTEAGRWVAYVQMVRKQLYYNNATEIANTPSPSNGDNAIDNSTGFVYAFVVGDLTGIVALDNFEGEQGSFVKIGETGEKGFINWVQNTVVSVLPSIVKTVLGSIVQLFDLKQRSNPSWDLSTVPTASDIVIDEVAKTITFGTINGAALSVNNPAIYHIDQTDGTVKKYLVTSPQVFTYTATYGIWWIYFGDTGGTIINGGVLQFGKMAPLLRFVYSTDDNLINTRVAEFHPDTLSAVAHKRAHAEGTVWISGGDVTANAITTGAPNADGRNTVIGLSSITNMDDNFEYTVQNSTAGGNWQQDLGANVAGSLTSANSGIFNITYNQTAGSRLRVLQGTRFPFPWNVATNKPQTISELGVFTDVPNNYFFCSFIYVLQDFKTGEPVRLRTSTVSFATIEAARAYAWETLKGYSPTLSDNEIRAHLKCIWEVKSAWDAGCKYAALRETQYIRQNPLTAITAGSVSTTAANTTVEASVFNGNLATTDTNVQACLQKFDTHIPLTKVLTFSNFISLVNLKAESSTTLTSVIDFTPISATSIVDGNSHYLRIMLNGFIPTFSGFKFIETQRASLDFNINNCNVLMFFKIFDVYYYTILDSYYYAGVDVTPPILSGVSISNTTDLSTTLNVTANENCNLYYAVYAGGSTSKTASQIKAGTGAISFSNVAMIAGFEQNINIALQTQSTLYDIRFVATDSSLNDSILQLIQVTTLATNDFLQANYKLITATTDETGNYPMTQSGTIANAIGADLIADSAKVFTSSGYLYRTAFINIYGELTISCWIKKTAETGFKGMLSQTFGNSTNAQIYLALNDGLFVLYISGQTITIPTTRYDDGNYHHIVVTIAGAAVNPCVTKIYIDNILKNTFSVNLPVAQTLIETMIGRIVPNNYYFNGTIDNVRIYADVKDAVFISNLYTNKL